MSPSLHHSHSTILLHLLAKTFRKASILTHLCTYWPLTLEKCHFPCTINVEHLTQVNIHLIDMLSIKKPFVAILPKKNPICTGLRLKCQYWSKYSIRNPLTPYSLSTIWYLTVKCHLGVEDCLFFRFWILIWWWKNLRKWPKFRSHRV